MAEHTSHTSHAPRLPMGIPVDSAIADRDEISPGWYAIPFTGSSAAENELPLPSSIRFTGPVGDDSQLW